MINAYSLAEQVMIVDRADLYGDDSVLSSGEETDSSDLDVTRSDDLLRQLYDFLGTSLDTSAVGGSCAGDSDGDALDTEEKESIEVEVKKKGKKKKRKNKLDHKPLEELAFRLLPGAPIKISLTTTQHRGHVLVRPAEDTIAERTERAARVQAPGVVVDLNDITQQGQAMRSKPSKLEVVRLQAEADNRLPVIMVTEKPRSPAPKRSGVLIDVLKHHSGATTMLPLTPTPFCPVVQLLPSDQMPSPKPTRRRRRRTHARPHRPPTFFRPEHRSQGYALGWPSSYSARSHKMRGRYQRDEMRQGALAKPFIPADPPRRLSRRGHKRWPYANKVDDDDDGAWMVSPHAAVVKEGLVDDVESRLAVFSGDTTAFMKVSLEDGDEEDPEVGWGGDWVTPGSLVTEPPGEDTDVQMRVAFFAEAIVGNENRRSRRALK
ncbi:hypothetical protein FRB98_006912 [Tulasnella sp. 332]|nr:hypothetical protein FRB98_006912 [Tulasnella sp. 332]